MPVTLASTENFQISKNLDDQNLAVELLASSRANFQFYKFTNSCHLFDDIYATTNYSFPTGQYTIITPSDLRGQKTIDPTKRRRKMLLDSSNSHSNQKRNFTGGQIVITVWPNSLYRRKRLHTKLKPKATSSQWD